MGVMQKLTCLLVLLSHSQIVNGQDSLRRFELGSTLLTVNSLQTVHYYPPDRPVLELMNGLFFRYTKKRLALRLHAGYSEITLAFDSPLQSSGNEKGSVSNKDLRLGVGGQLSLLRRKEFLYVFLDASYRNVFSTGYYFWGLSGAPDTFSRTANGFDCFAGLGFKIKTFRYVFVSPELGYFCASRFISQTNPGVRGSDGFSFRYSETDLYPAAKLHLTVQF
jgi:hypothetical protein